MSWFKKKPKVYVNPLDHLIEGMVTLIGFGILSMFIFGISGVVAIIWAIGHFVFHVW
jgi:hypothetical protein